MSFEQKKAARTGCKRTINLIKRTKTNLYIPWIYIQELISQTS